MRYGVSLNFLIRVTSHASTRHKSCSVPLLRTPSVSVHRSLDWCVHSPGTRSKVRAYSSAGLYALDDHRVRQALPHSASSLAGSAAAAAMPLEAIRQRVRWTPSKRPTRSTCTSNSDESRSIRSPAQVGRKSVAASWSNRRWSQRLSRVTKQSYAG